MKQYLIIFGIITTLASCNTEAKEGDDKKEEAKDKGLMVDGIVLQTTDITKSMETNGSLEANERFPLKAEIQGRVEKIDFKEGDRIKKGQLLAVIDAEELRSQLKEVNESLELAKNNLKRAEQLIEIEGISQQEYDELKSQVAQLESQKGSLNARMRNARIYSPYNGIVGLRNVSPGAYLSPGDIIATLMKVHPLKVHFTLPEQKAYDITIGDTVVFHVKGVRDSVKARIYARESGIDVATRSMQFRAICIDKADDLFPGTFVRIEIPLRRIKDAIMVPSEALMLSMDATSVFVARNGKAHRIDVKTGHRGPAKVHVEEGLAKGDTLITTGLLKLNDGDKINLSL